MTMVILTRHGHVAWHSPERFRGRAALPLTDKGQRQAAATAAFIQSAWPEAVAVFTSPMGRCVDTGATIAAALGVPAETHDGLADLDYGAWQGLTRDEVEARWPAEAGSWCAAPHLAVIPQGETLPEVAARATRAVRSIIARHAPSATIVVVGHDSVNRALLCLALGLPLSRYWRIGQDACAVNALKFADDDFVVRLLNGTAHLAGIDNSDRRAP